MLSKYLFVTISILFLGYLAAPIPTAAANPAADTLTRDQEISLATSGALEHLRKDCTVYVLDGKKYVKAREGSNGITCVVFRDGPGASEPICYDEEGARSNMLVDMKRSEFRKEEMSEEEIEKKISEGYKAGEFKAPQRSGVAYMLSENNFIYNPGGKAAHYPPHIMFYAPYLKNSEIGARKEDFGSTTVPWVLSEGTPQAYIIVVPGGEVHQH